MLSGKDVENDIMQAIQVRLIKTCISGFIRHDCCDGSINNDPEGFKRWLTTVAHNVERDFSMRQRRRRFNERCFEDGEEASIADISEDSMETSLERVSQLKQAFTIVIESDAKVCKVLTWIAQFLFVLQYDTTKIKSNKLIIAEFEKKTVEDFIGRQYIKNDILFRKDVKYDKETNYA